MSTKISSKSVAVDEPSALLDFWPRFLMFPLLAFLIYPFWVGGWFGQSLGADIATVVVLSYSWFCVGGAFHEASHQTLFKNEGPNVWFGRLMGAMIFIPYTVYKESHRNHHAYLNTSRDYELWPYSNPECSLWFRRAYVWIDLVFAVATAPYIYGRIYLYRDPRLRPKVVQAITMEYLGIALFWAAVIGSGIYYGYSQGWTWQDVNPLWVAPLAIAATCNTMRKFVEHLGMTSRDPMQGTRTIAPTNWWNRMLNYFNFDIAVHGPHHRYPRAHHYELLSKFNEAREKNPETQYPQFKSYYSAIMHTLPCLWNYPATGVHEEETQGKAEQAETNLQWEAKHDLENGTVSIPEASSADPAA